jgi:secretion/DNA translocation related TadE-like protein
MSDRGTISIFIAATSLLLAFASLAVADVGAMLHARGRAQAAADAAALAAVVQQAPVLEQGDDPEAAAREAAELGGATLLDCECEVGTTDATVEVEVLPRLSFLRGWAGRRARATARAHLDPDVLTYRDS